MPNLLITGINGFIGSWCKKHFEKTYTVFGIDNNVEPSKNFIKGRVSKENLEKFNTKFNLIIHLAGTSTVGNAQKNPENERVRTVESAKELIEYVINNNREAKVIFVSSASVYGNNCQVAIKENIELEPISEYGKHKLEVEQMCVAAREKGLNYIILRLFSVYGEGLKKQLLWDFSQRLKEHFDNAIIPCFGTGEEERDYIHIKDVVSLIDLITKKSICGDIINGGTGIATTVSEVLDLLVCEYGYKGKLVYDNIQRQGNPQKLVADISQAAKLGFSPTISINQGIKEYASWFKKRN